MARLNHGRFRHKLELPLVVLLQCSSNCRREARSSPHCLTHAPLQCSAHTWHVAHHVSLPLPPAPPLSHPCPTPSDCKLLMGIFKLGFITIFLSEPLVSGYTTGAAVVVFTSQLRHIIGVDANVPPGLFRVPKVSACARAGVCACVCQYRLA